MERRSFLKSMTLVAVAIATGAAKFGGPVTITEVIVDNKPQNIPYFRNRTIGITWKIQETGEEYGTYIEAGPNTALIPNFKQEMIDKCRYILREAMDEVGMADFVLKKAA